MERRLDPHQRDVGPMQGRHDRQGARQHHPSGKIGADGVGNRIVDMHQVEAVCLRHLGDLDRQGESIRGVMEDRVVGGLHFVKEDVFPRNP